MQEHNCILQDDGYAPAEGVVRNENNINVKFYRQISRRNNT